MAQCSRHDISPGVTATSPTSKGTTSELGGRASPRWSDVAVSAEFDACRSQASVISETDPKRASELVVGLPEVIVLVCVLMAPRRAPHRDGSETIGCPNCGVLAQPKVARGRSSIFRSSASRRSSTGTSGGGVGDPDCPKGAGPRGSSDRRPRMKLIRSSRTCGHRRGRYGHGRTVNEVAVPWAVTGTP